jgi:hypothetical protein
MKEIGSLCKLIKGGGGGGGGLGSTTVISEVEGVELPDVINQLPLCVPGHFSRNEQIVYIRRR